MHEEFAPMAFDVTCCCDRASARKAGHWWAEGQNREGGTLWGMLYLRDSDHLILVVFEGKAFGMFTRAPKFWPLPIYNLDYFWLQETLEYMQDHKSNLEGKGRCFPCFPWRCSIHPFHTRRFSRDCDPTWGFSCVSKTLQLDPDEAVLTVNQIPGLIGFWKSTFWGGNGLLNIHPWSSLKRFAFFTNTCPGAFWRLFCGLWKEALLGDSSFLLALPRIITGSVASWLQSSKEMEPQMA